MPGGQVGRGSPYIRRPPAVQSTSENRMATYAQPCSKRQKTVRDSSRGSDGNEYFPGIGKIEYKGEAAACEETLCFRYYDAGERIHGRAMQDWLRPAVSFTAFKCTGSDSYGKPTFHRGWDDQSQSVENYKRCLKAGFEFCSKLGIRHWSAYDGDLVPEADTPEESALATEAVTEFLQEMQHKTGVKPLWVAPDLHSNPKYAGGAATSCDSGVMLLAARQVKRCLEMSHKLCSECFLVWGGREGCSSVLNTDFQREIKHFARLLKMASDFKERLGYRGQLLFKPWEHERKAASALDASHTSSINEFCPYTRDATSALCFLKHHNLEGTYKLCTPPGFQFYLSSGYNSAGCLEISQRDLVSVKDATLMMKSILEQGGIQPGGINLSIVPQRDSADARELFACYISCLDTLALGVRLSAKLLADQAFTKTLQWLWFSSQQW